MRQRRLRRRYGASKTRRPSRAEMIAALGLEPEGRTRGQKYAFSTSEFWTKIRTHDSEAARKARATLGVKGGA